jgi:isoquinoline 1-oxidoreductase alpha subunit
MTELRINGVWRGVESEPEKPLLWTLREDVKLTGTKYGCGIGLCGACTVHVDGAAVRSCSMATKDALGKDIVTIEGLSREKLHPVLRAWIEEQVPQCGYCQPGFIMATAALLARTPRPTDEEIEGTLTNLCRCGTYDAMRRAIARAIVLMARKP